MSGGRIGQEMTFGQRIKGADNLGEGINRPTHGEKPYRPLEPCIELHDRTTKSKVKEFGSGFDSEPSPKTGDKVPSEHRRCTVS